MYFHFQYQHRGQSKALPKAADQMRELDLLPLETFVEAMYVMMKIA
jgi:hypothetical protein